MTKTSKSRVVLVEDTYSEAELYTDFLRREPVEVTHVSNGRDAIETITEMVPDLVLLDLQLPDMTGLDVLRDLRERGVPVTAVVVTAHGSINTAVEAMQAGAIDFVVKPFNANRLQVTVRNALERQELTQIVQTLKSEFGRNQYHGFIGSSLAMQGVYRTIDAAARSKATVFVTGESGTGKEVCAEAIHAQSTRSQSQFVPLNCAAIPRDLMESEIFGHVKGAFTGATSDREGAAVRADKGTLFLDEICEMDLDLQAKLLRFIQTGVVQPVGSSKDRKVDVRFVCATNRDPWQEVMEGRFREDLYYRLHVIPIQLPPLRDREGDIFEIARSFLQRFAQEEGKAFEGFDAEAESTLGNYDWPGNIRQLQNVVRNIVVLHDGDAVTADMLPPPVSTARQAPSARPLGSVGAPAAPVAHMMSPGTAVADETGTTIEPLWLTEQRTIERAIDLCDGNIPKAAALLEISPSTIYRKKLTWKSQGAA